MNFARNFFVLVTFSIAVQKCVAENGEIRTTTPGLADANGTAVHKAHFSAARVASNFSLNWKANQSVIVAVIADFTDKNDSSLFLTKEKASYIFSKAISPGNSNKTKIVVYNNQESYLHPESASNSMPPNRTVEILPVFVDASFSLKMLASLEQSINDHSLAAVLDVATCLPDRCRNILDLSQLLPEETPIISTCCFDSHTEEEIAASGTGPTLVYESLEPHSMVHLTMYLAETYNWRRFHFVISPHWSTFDILYRDYKEIMDEEQLVAENKAKASGTTHRTLIITHSYFCTDYLVAGHLCSENQAKELLLRQATAIFMMLDPETDMRDFIKQVNDIDDGEDRLLSGKAIFLVHITGVIAPIADDIVGNAPDGLMIIRQKRVVFEDYKPDVINGMEGIGTDALMYTELRLWARAIQVFHQIPGEYRRLSELFCGTAFYFSDSSNYIGYSEHCDRDFVVVEILNVKSQGEGKPNIVDRVFTILGGVFRHSEPRWLGSGSVPPREDFCKLDGAGCPIPPIDLVPIVTPAAIGSAVGIALIITLIVLGVRRAQKLAKEEDMIRDLVLVKPNELQLKNGLFAADNSSEGTGTPRYKMKGKERPDEIANIPDGAVVKVRGESAFVTQIVGRSRSHSGFGFDSKIIRELVKLRDLHHPHINAFLGVTYDSQRFLSLQAQCAKGTLGGILVRPKIKLNKMFKISFVNDIASALSYLHQSALKSHGQLTSENIFVDNRWSCKIGNFPIPSLARMSPKQQDKDITIEIPNGNQGGVRGVGRRISQQFSQFSNAFMDAQQKIMKRTSTTSYGDPNAPPIEIEPGFYWTAPELLRMPKATRPPRGTPAGDVYSFGMIVFEVFSRQRPFAAFNLPDTVLFEKLRLGRAPHFRPNVTAGGFTDEVWGLMELAKNCWVENPEQRPHFREILDIVSQSNNGKEINLVDQIIHSLESNAEKLEEAVAAKTRELSDEKERSHDYLAALLPKFIIDQMKAGRISQPELYPSATILSCDIVDFADLIAEATPSDAIRFLESYNDAVSRAMGGYDVHKFDVSGSGDSCMIAGGVPSRNSNTHVTDIASMALEFLTFVKELKVPNQSERHGVQVRCGIHTGQVIGGVVGISTPRYFLIGDSVKFTSRLKSTCPHSKIHISAQTKLALEVTGVYRLEERKDKVEIKGRGVTETWFLLGKVF